jgi:hypothetical protein
MQCSTPVAAELHPCAFRQRVFDTTLIRLEDSEAHLWSRLDSKSCRHEITKARRLSCQVLVNERKEHALALLNESIELHRHRRPISATEWQRTVEACDVFVVMYQDSMLAAHVLLVDYPRRARLLFSATVDRRHHPHRALVGPLNRFLHWCEFIHYKERGMNSYDFGGVELDKSTPTYSISRFKLSFGGDVVRENIVRLAGNAALRMTLRTAAAARDSAKRIRARR